MGGGNSSPHFYAVGALDVHHFTRFLLRNGLSFFYGVPLSSGDANRMFQWKGLVSQRAFEWGSPSLMLPFFQLSKCYSYAPFVGGIVRQLLALGYGRRELHPAPLALFDENLDDMRRELARLSFPFRRRGKLLKLLVEQFSAGPLSLQRLARITIRRDVGGADFSRQVKRLAGRIPPPLLEYIADPTELMPSDDEVYRRVSVRFH